MFWGTFDMQKQHCDIHHGLDKQDILDGQDWEKSFRLGLKHSCVYMPLVSAASLESVRMTNHVKLVLIDADEESHT